MPIRFTMAWAGILGRSGWLVTNSLSHGATWISRTHRIAR